MPVQLKDASAEELQHYVIHEHIGSGAAGEAFKVTDRRDRHEYVLKEMSLQSMSDEEKLRARQEIDVMNNVNHPNVVKFRESFSGVDSVDIVMEYCAGGTLEELITRQRYEGKVFPGNVILEWMAQLLCALAHIHAKGILHRDIKTGNIFVTTKNHLKLGDFGVCTLLTNKKIAEASLIGTPLYFSPEVCEQKAYDERSDVWSLGIVFYEMCTLRRPFEANNLLVLVNKITSEEVAPFNTGLDLRFEEIVRDMLNKDPVKRPTAQALIDDYLEVPRSHPSHPSQKPALSRYIQQQHGPTLKYIKPWPISQDELAKYANGKIANQNNNTTSNNIGEGVNNEECCEGENSYNVTSEWLDTCEAIDLAVLLQTNAFAYRNEINNGAIEQNTFNSTNKNEEKKSEKGITNSVSNKNKTDAINSRNSVTKLHQNNKSDIESKPRNIVLHDNVKPERKDYKTTRSKCVLNTNNNNINTSSEKNKTTNSYSKETNSSTNKKSKTSTCSNANKRENAQLTECKGNNEYNGSNINRKKVVAKNNNSTANKPEAHDSIINVPSVAKEKFRDETSSSKLQTKQIVKEENLKETNNANHKSTEQSNTHAVQHENNFNNKAENNKLHNNKKQQNTKLIIRTNIDENNKDKVQDKVKNAHTTLPRRQSVNHAQCTSPMATSLSMSDVQHNILRTRQAIFGESALERSNPSFVVELPLKRVSSSVKGISSALAQLSESLNFISINNGSPTVNKKGNNNSIVSNQNIISFIDNNNSMPSNYDSNTTRNNSINKYKMRENSENSNDNKYSVESERNTITSINNNNANIIDSAMANQNIEMNKKNNNSASSFTNQLHLFITDYVKTHNAIELNDIIKSIALLDNYRRVNYTGRQ